MITQLYDFAPGSYVVADEWNANFSALNSANIQHAEAITDAQNTIAFPNSNLSNVFNAVRNNPNSSIILGNSIAIAPEQEYYKILSSGENLVINIPTGLKAEARILIQLQENRTLLPFTVNYSGTKTISYGFYNYNYFRSGYYYIMIYETNGFAQIKLIWTGVNE